MKFESYLSFVFALVFAYSFGQKKAIEANLKNCVNEKVNYHIQERYGKNPFDFYEFISKIETEFQSSGVLSDLNKKSYLHLLNKIHKRKKRKFKKLYHKQNLLINKYGFDAFSTENIFNQCPYKVSVDFKESEGRLIYNQSFILFELMKVEFYDEQLLNELFNIIDEQSFSKIVYRAPIILLVMINLNSKYNRDFIKRKRQLKGKSIFGDQMK